MEELPIRLMDINKPELRPYQVDAIRRLEAAEASGKKKIILQALTGLGKTVVSCALMEHAVASGLRVLFLAHRRDLIFQCANKIREFGLNCGIVMGSEAMNHSEPIQVASVQSLHGRGIKRNRIAMPDADLVIIDEVHKSLSTTYLDIINHYSNSIILGLTATPCRSDGRGLGHVFEHMEVCMKMDQAVKEGWLVPVRYFAPSVPDLKGIKVTAGDYNQGQLEDRLDQVKLIGDIVENWTRLGDNRQTVIFSSGVKHAMHIAEAFRAAGHNFEYVCGDTPQEERNRVNRGLADGTIRGVANAMVWTEGWDNPRVSCAILARPTKSPGLYIQMAGRILRPYPGKSDAKIIDHSGSIYNLGRLDEYSDWELNADGNLFKQVQEKIKKKGKEITCESCKAVYSGERRCPECGNEPKSFGKGIEFIDGRLYELGTQPALPRNPATAPSWLKQKWYSQILCYAELRGYKMGWVSHTYRDKFGVWPRGLSSKVEQPGKEVMAHIQKKIMQYKYMQRGQGANRNA